MIEAICLFAAYVTAAPAFNNFNVIRQRSDPPCVVDHQVAEGNLILARADVRVVLPVPQRTGWYAVEFMWGNQWARFKGKGGAVAYVPVQRE